MFTMFVLAIVISVLINSLVVFILYKHTQLSFKEEIENQKNNCAKYILDKLDEKDDVSKTEVSTEKKQNKKNYSDINILELRKIAKNRKIKGYYNMKKEQLVKELEK